MALNPSQIRATFRTEYKRLREIADEDGVLPVWPTVKVGRAYKKLGHANFNMNCNKNPASAGGIGYDLDHFYFSDKIATTEDLKDTIGHEVAHALAVLHYGRMCLGKNDHGPIWQEFARMCGARPECRAIQGAIDPMPYRYFVVCNPCDKNVLALHKRSKRWQAVAMGRHAYRCGRCGSSSLRAV